MTGPELLPHAVARIDVDVDTLFDRIATLNNQVRELTERVRDLERPPPAKFPARYFRVPLHKSLAALDKHLANGEIDQDLYEEARRNLERAEERWQNPERFKIEIDLLELFEKLNAPAPRKRHLHPVTNDEDDEDDQEEGDEADGDSDEGHTA